MEITSKGLTCIKKYGKLCSVFISNLFSIKSQPAGWRPATLFENVLQRHIAENFPIILKKLPCRTHVVKPMCRSPFNEIAGINSRSAALMKEKPPPRSFTCEYIRNFSASTGRFYMSSAFLKKLRVVYYRIVTLLRHWSTINFFLKKKDLLFSRHFFRYIHIPKRIW